MKVTVVPMRPIPGILPKNKWIDEKMELDLNRNEIIRCMQYGNVYDENDNIINHEYLNNLDNTIKPSIEVVAAIGEGIQLSNGIVDEEVLPPVITKPEFIPIEEADNEEFIKPELVKDYTIELVSCKKEENYIVLETEFKTSVGKIGGNMYGLFNISAGKGNRPSAEFMIKNNWVKFNNKFNNYDVLENGDKFIFRFIPKNNSVLNYRIQIKQANEILAKLDGEINPDTL